MKPDDSSPGRGDGAQPAVERSGARAPGAMPAPGMVVLGRYRIERELGRGAQAVVFEARDLELDRPVALKVLMSVGAGGRGDDWQGLLDEARLQAAVEAPGVARLVDALSDGERRYLVLELVRGPGLKEVIAALRDRRLSTGERPRTGAALAEAAGLAPDSAAARDFGRRSWDSAVADFGASLARSVGSLHERGLIHRDLKPGNIKLDGSGRPVVLDFGLARWLDAPASGRLQGTPGYMAPEQLSSGARLDARTDVYQLGLILYELLTLERAYPPDVVQDTSRFIEFARAGRVRALEDVDSRADPGLAAVIARALAPLPGERYDSLAALTGDLQRASSGRAPLGARTPLSHRARCQLRSAARRPTVAALLSAALLAPVAWSVRAALLEEVTSVEGWCFSPETSRQFDVVSGSVVRVGDDLGVRVATSAPRTLYVLSVFGGAEPAQRMVSPMRPSSLVNGVPQANRSPVWGLELQPGTHELVCTRIVDPNPREGLIVFATETPSRLFETWLRDLDRATTGAGLGVTQEQAFAMLDGTYSPPRTRGGAVLPTSLAGGDEAARELANERERYAGLSAAKAAGSAAWDLGADLIRFEVLCQVVAD